MKKDVLLKPLEASKWLRYPVLMSKERLDVFLNHSDCHVFNISKVMNLEELEHGKLHFQKAYEEYLACLNFKIERSSLSVALTKNRDDIAIKEMGEDRYIARPIYPVVQISPFTFAISQDGKILSHAFGKASIPFGLELSYPAIYRDLVTSKIENGLLYPSALLWKECKAFLRNHFDFLRLNIKGEIIKTPFRVEKGCEYLLESISSLQGLVA